MPTIPKEIATACGCSTCVKKVARDVLCVLVMALGLIVTIVGVVMDHLGHNGELCFSVGIPVLGVGVTAMLLNGVISFIIGPRH